MEYTFGFSSPTKMGKVAELEELVFGPSLSAQWFDDMILRTALFRFEGIRIAEHDGRVVSALMVLPKIMRIGTASVLACGIAGVATHPDHRRKGLATQLLTDSISYMKKIGCSISTLGTTSPAIYQRLGWEIAQPSYSYQIDRRKLLSLDRSPFEARPFRRMDLDEVMAIDQETNACRTGSLVRNRDDWEREIEYPCIHRRDLHESREFETFLVSLREGSIASYARCMMGEDITHIMECGVREESSLRAILRHLFEHESSNIAAIEANMPLDHPLVRLLLDLGAKDNSSYSGLASGGLSARMVRIIDIPRLLESIQTELTRRASRVKRMQGSLRIQVGQETVSINVSNGKVDSERDAAPTSFYRTTSNVMARIVMGQLLPSEAVGKGLAEADTRSLGLLDCLFPRGYPMHRSIDPLCQ